MKKIDTDIPEVFIIEPDVYGDNRGFFMELWRENNYQTMGIKNSFVQDNLSKSTKGVLRGLHYQWPNPQGKLVTVLQGSVFDVAVDIRYGSPTFGKWVGFELSEKNKRQFWIPPGFAHGFMVVSDEVLFSYKCTNYYAPQNEKTILWNDPQIDIKWPDIKPLLSDKDLNGKLLNNDNFKIADLPAYLAD